MDKKSPGTPTKDALTIISSRVTKVKRKQEEAFRPMRMIRPVRAMKEGNSLESKSGIQTVRGRATPVDLLVPENFALLLFPVSVHYNAPPGRVVVSAPRIPGVRRFMAINRGVPWLTRS